MALRCGLLGRKLGHSYSPMIHEAFGLGYSYELFEKEPRDIANFLENGSWHGLNVTIPYKVDAMKFCTKLSPAASTIGSINTMLRQPDGEVFGENTDCIGFEKMVAESGVDPARKKVLILGDGGSSRAVVYVMRKLGAGKIIKVGLRRKNNYGNISRHFDAQIIVNATPVGMYPGNGETLVNVTDFPRLECVLDLIYNPAKTKLMLDAQKIGVAAVGGLIMLVGQAAAGAAVFSGGKQISAAKEENVLNLLRRKAENIVLIGMPGSGKTTIGQQLAEKLGRSFVDTDAEIEKVAGETILQIFQREGELGFRRHEAEVIRLTGRESGLVISTGGGCVTVPENYNSLTQNSMIIFIQRDVAKLSRDGRPLSMGADMNAMYKQRLPMYERFADITVDNNHAPGDAVAGIIAARMDIKSQ
ncbi:MAG: AAA family ATPase [Defluviitaleaceae bacterium]|nr:AAA family ATPase [Defluviitaleaceae bacterium]